MDREEKRLLQVGGLGGVLAGVMLIPAFVFMILSQRPGGTGSVEQTLQDAITYRTSILVGFSLFFATSLLAIPLFLALYRNLREASLGYALLGTVLGVLSSTILAITVSVYALFSSGLANLYASATTPDQKMVAVSLAQVIFYENASLIGGLALVGTVFSGLALLVTGGAMRQSTTFHKGLGWMSIVFGVVFIILGSIGPIWPGFFFTQILLIFWFILVGLRVYRLSKVT